MKGGFPMNVELLWTVLVRPGTRNEGSGLTFCLSEPCPLGGVRVLFLKHYESLD